MTWQDIAVLAIIVIAVLVVIALVAFVYLWRSMDDRHPWGKP